MPGPRLTRRRLLAAGGAATAALIAAPASVARTARPSHLVRSSYTGLRSRAFVAAGATLTLVEVADIQGAQRRSDNAFSLLFKGPRGAAAGGPTSLRHPELGGFELFLAPVAAPGADQRYEAVINRSVAPSAPADPPAAPALVAAPPPAGPRARVRRAIARRSARGAVVTLTVGPEVEEISAWLVRGGRVLAASSRAAVRGRRVRIRMRTRRPLRAGRHHVVVIATAADGTTGSARIRVRRR